MTGSGVDSRFAHRPGLVLRGAALLYATLAAGFVATSSVASAALCTVGLLALVTGVSRPDRRITAAGSFALLAGVLVAGLTGVAVLRLAPAAVAAVVSGEFSRSAFDAAGELRGGVVERAELVHVGAVTGVAVVVTALVTAIHESLVVEPTAGGALLLLLATGTLGASLLR